MFISLTDLVIILVVMQAIPAWAHIHRPCLFPDPEYHWRAVRNLHHCSLHHANSLPCHQYYLELVSLASLQLLFKPARHACIAQNACAA